MTTSLDEITDMQKVLMDKVPHELRPEIQRSVIAGIGLMEEVHEYLNSLGHKPWRPHPLPRHQQLKELTDMLFFFLEMKILSGFSWEQIFAQYKKKHAENLSRYKRASQGDFGWDKRLEKEEL